MNPIGAFIKEIPKNALLLLPVLHVKVQGSPDAWTLESEPSPELIHVSIDLRLPGCRNVRRTFVICQCTLYSVLLYAARRV